MQLVPFGELKSPLVKRALQEALDDLRHKRYVTLKDYLRGKRSH